MDALERERRIQTVCLLILSAVAIAVALFWLRSVMVPFVLAAFFAFALTPLIDLQVRYLRMPRAVALLATLALGFVTLNLLAALLSASLSQLTAKAGAYQLQFERLMRQGVIILERFGVDSASAFNPSSLVSAQTVGGMLVSTTNSVLGIVSQGALVMIFLFFILIGGSARPQPATGVWGEVESRIKRYILTKVVTSAATGILVGAVLMVLGVDLAMVFGLFAFLLNFIPSIGSIIATFLPLPVVLFSPDISHTAAVLAIALPAFIQFSIGSLIEPKLMGSSLDLHPVTILLTLILWGMLWGVVGMLLATPMTAVMKILFEKMEITAPVAELLAGRVGRFTSR